jgi:hypothetical protein
MIKLELEPNEFQFILNVLGKLPTESGCYPLVIKIQEQANKQVEPPAE